MAKKNIFDLNSRFTSNGSLDNWRVDDSLSAAGDGTNGSAAGVNEDSISSIKDGDAVTADVEANGRYVYLTFDDGLQPGTEEVLNVLKKQKVKGTFFLTGIHVKDFIENHDRTLGLKLLKDIYQNHYIGNHSYSHANLFYKNYYSKGLKIGKNSNGFIYRTVLEDFQKNDEIINEYLKEAGITMADDWQWQVARFPGRNTWYRTSYKNAVSDTLDEAKALYAKDYYLYGWDVEWDMDFDIVELQKKAIQDRVDNNTMDWTNEAHTHPDYDLYDPLYIDKDRVNEKWSDVVEDIDDHSTRNYWEWPFDSESVKLGHVVVLMHERAFRHGANNSQTHPNKLFYLISRLKKRGFTFATMFDYATK